MPKSAARALGLLPYCSRQDIVACGAVAQAACREDRPTDGMWGKKSAITMMRRRRGSMRRYAHSEDFETEVRRSGAMDHRANRVTTRALQPPLQLIPSFQRPRAFSAHSNCPETWQERRAQVIRRTHSESEHIVAQIALNNTKTTLVVFKSLTARADIPELHKQLPQVGLAQVSCPCHVGGRPTSRIVL